VHLPPSFSLVYPAGSIVIIVIETSATCPREAHLHYHNQEVNGVDDEGDYLDCVGHDDGSCNVVYVERGRLYRLRLCHGATGLAYIYRRDAVYR
jgi:hypothetical protein